MVKQILMLLVMASLLMAPHVPVHATTIDFESLADLDLVTTQFSGLLFTHTQVLTAGITLDEFELPPASGTKVVIDNDGTITIDFAVPQDAVSGFFTYTTPLLITALDSSNHVVATATSAFASNLVLSGVPGSSPNELLSVTFAGGITHVTIAGDPFGGLFHPRRSHVHTSGDGCARTRDGFPAGNSPDRADGCAGVLEALSQGVVPCARRCHAFPQGVG